MKQSHPNLYLGFLTYGLWGLVMGISFVVFSSRLGGMPTLIFGLAYVMTGSMKLIGLHTDIKLARLGMVGCIMLSALAGMGAIIAAVTVYNSDPETSGLLIILGITMLFYGSITQFAPLQEPVINPLTMKKPE